MNPMETIREPERQVPVAGAADVIVAGGGIAGVAAALAAARSGAKTMLLEREFLPGGLATLGLVTIFLPLCDGLGTQVSFGIAEELLRLSVRYGCEAGYPKAWLENGSGEEKRRKRFSVRYSAPVFGILCEQLLAEAGVDILYGTAVCGAITRNGRLDALITENKSGRLAWKGGAIVDATGDADVCRLAGEDTALFGQGNRLAGWYYEQSGSGLGLKTLGAADIPDKYKTEPEPASALRYGGVDGRELSRMTMDSHRMTLADFLSKGEVGPAHHLTALSSIPQVRMTRRLEGVCTPDDGADRTYTDSIGMIGDWRRPGPVYELPFRCLYGRKLRNLITAGRCISVTDAMWDITRVIPACAVTGQAAGTAAALLTLDDSQKSADASFSRLPVEALQAGLQSQGVRLHRE